MSAQLLPSSYGLIRDIDNARKATNAALAAQYEVGRKRGRAEAWLLMGAIGMCCFVGGGVFVAAFSHLVIGALA